MKVFKDSALLFKLNCCLTPNYTNKWRNIGCRSYAVIYVVTSLLCGWSSYLYFAKYYSTSKEEAFCAIYQLVVVFGPLTTFLAETVFGVIFCMHYFSSSSGYATLLATICEYHIAFCKIVNYHITKIDGYVQSGTNRKDDLIKMYHKTISFHVAAKELFVKTDDIYCFFVAPELTHFMLFSTSIIFHSDHAIRHLNIHFVLMTFGMLYGVAILYLYCYYGQRATDSYFGIADHSYNSDWMNLPIGLQRMYVLIIAHAQKGLYFRGAGMVELNRETFLRIVKTIVGYVFMFKTMTEQRA